MIQTIAELKLVPGCILLPVKCMILRTCTIDTGVGFKSETETGFESEIETGFESETESGFESETETGFESETEIGFESETELVLSLRPNWF